MAVFPAPPPSARANANPVYAYTIAYDPATGEVRFDDRTGLWVAAPSPATECVLLILRTQLGSARAQPGLGVDWNALRKATTGVASTARILITRALQPLVLSNTISGLNVTVYPIDGAGASQGGARLLYAVTFVDSRLAVDRPGGATTVRFTG
jgi:hypothetical protein